MIVSLFLMPLVYLPNNVLFPVYSVAKTALCYNNYSLNKLVYIDQLDKVSFYGWKRVVWWVSTSSGGFIFGPKHSVKTLTFRDLVQTAQLWMTDIILFIFLLANMLISYSYTINWDQEKGSSGKRFE